MVVGMADAADGTTKTCAKCAKDLVLSEFHRDSSSPDGRVKACKPCVAARSKRRYVSKSDEIRAGYRTRYALNHDKIRARIKEKYHQDPEKMRQRMRDYCRKRPDVVHAAEKKWRTSNHERRQLYKREWEKKHPESRKIQLSRYRALLKSSRICTIKRADLEARILAFGGVCAYCSAAWEHLDHVKPISRGGAHCLANLRPACAPCNRKKSAMPAKEWLAKLPKATPLSLP